jgi:3-hydroxybutyryl-CoA dehydrogenase
MERPITIVGAGTLGRRIALMLSTRGSEVRIFDPNPASRAGAAAYVAALLPQQLAQMPGTAAANLVLEDDLAAAVADAWLIVEAVPENVELKRDVFGQLDTLSPADAILASNSSSYPSSRFIDHVSRPERVLNTHFYMPPDVLAVELMSCGKTDPAVIDRLMECLPQYGFVPFKVRSESVGFIFNRIWAAIKREALAVVAEGVAAPEEVDTLYSMFVAKAAAPFRMMDAIGLDVVLDIEEHYASVRDGIPEAPRKLLHEYLDNGWLGCKSGRGFYDDYAPDRAST